jgi:SlyX protein
MDELQERLTDLEVRYSHQGLLIEQLNEVVTECCARIDRLEKNSRRLREHLMSLAPDDLTLSPDE